MTTETHKRALARMLPERVEIVGGFIFAWKHPERQVLDTELLALVREVELGLTLEELAIYNNILLEICTEVPPLIAPWEKRVEGLEKLNEIEL